MCGRDIDRPRRSYSLPKNKNKVIRKSNVKRRAKDVMMVRRQDDESNASLQRI